MHDSARGLGSMLAFEKKRLVVLGLRSCKSDKMATSNGGMEVDGAGNFL